MGDGRCRTFEHPINRRLINSPLLPDRRKREQGSLNEQPGGDKEDRVAEAGAVRETPTKHPLLIRR
jgi:hypothetical protein